MQLHDTEIGKKLQSELEKLGKRRTLNSFSRDKSVEVKSVRARKSRNESRPSMQQTLSKSKVLIDTKKRRKRKKFELLDE